MVIINNKVIKFHIINFFGLNMMPTVLVFLAMLPGLEIVGGCYGTTWLTWVGFFVCIGATLVELVADTQRHRFAREHKGEICNVGLWKQGRHPNYFGEITGQMRAFLERLAFPWLSYNDYSITAPKRMPVVLVETQNGGVGGSNCNGYGTMEPCISRALGQPEKLFANNTYQVKNYANFELGGFSEEAKRKYREEHWEADLQKAFDAGKRMAETIIKA